MRHDSRAPAAFEGKKSKMYSHKLRDRLFGRPATLCVLSLTGSALTPTVDLSRAHASRAIHSITVASEPETIELKSGPFLLRLGAL